MVKEPIITRDMVGIMIGDTVDVPTITRDMVVTVTISLA